MELAELFRHFGCLFETFHWWSLLLIAGVIAIMIPVNMLWKKLMNKEGMARLRKIIAFISVYVVATGVVTLFTAVATELTITASYLLGSALALGFCAQFGWEIVKLIRDYGFKKFISWIAQKIDADKIASQIATKYNVDKSLIKTLISETKSKLNENTDELEKAFAEDTQILSELHNRLATIVDANNVEAAAKEVFELITKK